MQGRIQRHGYWVGREVRYVHLNTRDSLTSGESLLGEANEYYDRCCDTEGHHLPYYHTDEETRLHFITGFIGGYHADTEPLERASLGQWLRNLCRSLVTLTLAEGDYYRPKSLNERMRAIPDRIDIPLGRPGSVLFPLEESQSDMHHRCARMIGAPCQHRDHDYTVVSVQLEDDGVVHAIALRIQEEGSDKYPWYMKEECM